MDSLKVSIAYAKISIATFRAARKLLVNFDNAPVTFSYNFSNNNCLLNHFNIDNYNFVIILTKRQWELYQQLGISEPIKIIEYLEYREQQRIESLERQIGT